MPNISVRDFLETVNYRISEGSDYGWQCYGPNAYCLDSWDGNQDGYSINIVFDTLTQCVYEMCAHDYQNNLAYRWIDAEYLERSKQSAQENETNHVQAWDDVNYIDLEMSEDMLSKARDIVLGKPYDKRVLVPLDLQEADLFHLMLRAHEQDITLNQMVEQILKDVIAKEEQKYDPKNYRLD